MTTTEYSDIYYKCRFCGKEMYYNGPQSSSLKAQKREHEKECKEYGDWITANTEEESRAQNKEFREEGRSRTRFEIHEILKNQVAIPRLEAKLRDNDFSTTPERMVLVELSHAKADLKNALKHLHELLYNNENESIRLAANEVYQRSINMTYKERLKEYNIF